MNHDSTAALVAEPAAQPLDAAVPEELARAVEGPRAAAGSDAGINETTEPAGPVHPEDPAPSTAKADESDAAFVLRTFGVLPQRFIKDGVLDRSALAWSVDIYRNLYANRVLSGSAA